ncbi:MAG: hypothetical protein IKN82_07610 [Treponema sp.]|nr:hypothetical protein [Treponema sp.]
MKKIGRALFCAACLSLLAASLYAAPKAKAPKDIWVAKEKNGMLVTTDANGWAQVDFGEEVDLSGYKYLQVECSSPDGKKFSHIQLIFGFVPEENEDYDWDQSAEIRIYGIQKKPALYQGVIYSSIMRYEHWENGKKIYRTPEKAAADHFNIGVYDANWKNIPNIKIFVKKVTATNNAIGQLHVIDYSKARFCAINNSVTWDDGSKHYAYWADLQKTLGTTPKAGDIVQLKLKGTNAYDLGNFSARVFDDSGEWQQVSLECNGRGFAKGQKINDTIDLPILKNGSKMTLEIFTFEDESEFKGPYLIYSK